MKLDRFDTAEQRRKLILQFVIDHPHSNTRQMADALDIGLDVSGSVAREMASRGELQKHGHMPNITYTACKTTTISAAEMRGQMMHKMAVARVEFLESGKPKPAPKLKPGHYVHTPTNPIPNQEAIGSGRRRVWAASTCGMV